ncbi:O-Methyltransferase involved in polyketide biosynthesis [Delftia tsuruhatensis]|uniref:class I SAM-dependent methyltransferase n=1 Tax=Delftia tsuruhatensis TaxID=180282 RepID=UPI001E717F07|nr:class I SAM-dependent methyltransferase [Delftia tsuruhatensis]CAB5712576.1 O-Methyltransferase involved in polyketide biosynthesis [Delftia tsuruhatensis]CAC9681964.1 O-Methyltransferase involved in polyketide biosynthesis [Delftia tsuruhatensis]
MPQLQGATATLLLTLAARARAATPGEQGLGELPAFADPEARRILAALPPDTPSYATDAAFVRGVVLRSLLFDRLAVEFLHAQPDSLCIALGAGLCTRRSRLATRGVAARWLNVDLPDAIALRGQCMAPSDEEAHLACSILDTRWLDAAGLPGRQPVLVLLEGVCPYLPQEPLQAMLHQLADRFARPGSPGCTVVLDHVHPLLAQLPMQVGGMRLPVVSGFKDSTQLAGLHPSMRVGFEEHPYARFSQQHQLFETAFHATTGQYPYAIVRLDIGGPPHA